MTLRTQTLLAMFAVSAAGLIVATVFTVRSLQAITAASIERTLAAEARLCSELLSHAQTVSSPAELEQEARTLGRFITARVTFIAADGRVIGDSALTTGDLPTLENHANRPEVVAARATGFGVERRFSATLNTDMLYVAIPVRHPAIAFVRLALPLSDIQQQLRAVWTSSALGFTVALGCAFALATASSIWLGRRVRSIASAARRYRAGDFSQPARDYGRDELGTVGQVLDDTARELGRRLAQLGEDRARMEAMLDGMVEGVLEIDATGRVRLANGAVCQMLKLEHPVDRPYVESIRHPDIAGLVTTALHGQSTDRLEFSLNRHPGRTFVARAAPVLSPAAGGAVLVIDDITDLRMADRIRRDFVANVSHELRTPLTAIRGYVEALGDDPLDPADRKRFLDIITRHTARMERLVHDLLRLARLEAGQEPIDMVPCAIEAVFTNVLTELATSVETTRHRVWTTVSQDVATVSTDAAKLHDALRNLVENAILYSPPGTAISLDAAKEDGRLVIRVADDGPGIPDAHLSRVFERFYRVDKARSRESGGTGLGLSIVKHLVERLGGRVVAASRPTGGAVFTITLPLEVAQPVATVAQQESATISKPS